MNACAITADSVPAIAPGRRFQWEEAQACYVILYPEGMVKLSASAGEILRHCDGRTTVGALIAALKAKFQGAELDGDVYRFLEEARERGWIRTG
jgi:pyrroloquinoline quinone biosynthesis protein D